MNIYLFSFFSSLLFVIFDYSYNKFFKNTEKKYNELFINAFFAFCSIILVDQLKHKFIPTNITSDSNFDVSNDLPNF